MWKLVVEAHRLGESGVAGSTSPNGSSAEKNQTRKPLQRKTASLPDGGRFARPGDPKKHKRGESCQHELLRPRRLHRVVTVGNAVRSPFRQGAQGLEEAGAQLVVLTDPNRRHRAHPLGLLLSKQDNPWRNWSDRCPGDAARGRKRTTPNRTEPRTRAMQNHSKAKSAATKGPECPGGPAGKVADGGDERA